MLGVLGALVVPYPAVGGLGAYEALGAVRAIEVRPPAVGGDGAHEALGAPDALVVLHPAVGEHGTHEALGAPGALVLPRTSVGVHGAHVALLVRHGALEVLHHPAWHLGAHEARRTSAPVLIVEDSAVGEALAHPALLAQEERPPVEEPSLDDPDDVP